jgi:alpha-1,6-mannosyltransferase
MTDSARRMAMLTAIGGGLVVLTVAGAAALAWKESDLDADAPIYAFMTTICLAGVLWLCAVTVVRRGAVPPRAIWLVLGVAVAMRVVTFVTPPWLSSDIYRYVWDGRVQLAGINPYRYIPAADELAYLRDDVWPHINRADYAPTVYPPAAQAIHALAAVVTPGVYGMKLMATLFDALAIGSLILLLRIAGRGPAELLIYAWLPLPAWEYVGNAHIDGAAAGLLALALLLSLRGRSVWVGIVLGVAALTKFLPAVVLPAFWRPRDWRLLIAFAATVVAFYVPYATVGWRVLGFLDGYVSEEGIASGHGFFVLQLLDTVVPLADQASKVYIVLALCLLGLLAARFAFATPLPAAPGARVQMQARQAAILCAVLLTAVSPHYPWYIGWLGPLACLAPLPGVLWMLAAAPLLAHGAYEYLAVPGTVYGPPIVLAMLGLYRIGARRLAAAPQVAGSA